MQRNPFSYFYQNLTGIVTGLYACFFMAFLWLEKICTSPGPAALLCYPGAMRAIRQSKGLSVSTILPPWEPSGSQKGLRCQPSGSQKSSGDIPSGSREGARLTFEVWFAIIPLIKHVKRTKHIHKYIKRQRRRFLRDDLSGEVPLPFFIWICAYSCWM